MCVDIPRLPPPAISRGTSALRRSEELLQELRLCVNNSTPLQTQHPLAHNVGCESRAIERQAEAGATPINTIEDGGVR